ncbi:Transcriptional regulator, AraC family [Streptomyces sp. HCCB10043]|uniref:Predicted protein n=1 Tax=Streptomyces filamentosus NRRL 15998 TaxID=457431 RepID=D6ABR9_STRFL|nr:predicted protein [Streptomyces filamentosus NRRL 15998]ESU47015.1 Transcriptional regulator, AraC family [Streptomyces sp. HCCB10043]
MRRPAALRATTAARRLALARILRLQRALALVRTGLPFADAACAAGCTDQAHLAREMRDLAGTTLGRVRRIMTGSATPGTAPRGVAETPESLRDEGGAAPCDAPHQTPRPIRS